MALNWIVARPVVVAPMAGGVSTPGLVLAAARAGALGFLAAGYKSAAALRAQVDEVRAGTDAPFGVNVFVPGSRTADPASLAAYLASLEPDAVRLGAAPGGPGWDDDDFDAKIAELSERPVPVVSFTFGCPHRRVLDSLRAAGSSVWVTVTDLDEARAALSAGAQCLVAQGIEAAAHRGTFGNEGPAQGGGLHTADLLASLRGDADVPLVAAGGIMTGPEVAATLRAGATAVQCGTAFLRSPESGAHPLHKAALADPRFDGTAMTRAFSGRPARGLVNAFLRDHADAPPAYPEINNATRPLRAAAAAAGDVDRMSLWAGEGYRLASDRPVGEVVDQLCGEL